ncbi:MAG: DNRLRE domain-containing protein [Phycisphaerae bacterium]|nr:DNRLRE domain-containing protein [Phycisphaerae bacterium]MDW8261193.1 DNRLRE domain-containing protein [Phycisphaerales bacterium]
MPRSLGRIGLLAALTLLWTDFGSAAERLLPAVADNTLFSEMPPGQTLSNGAGPHVFVGLNRFFHVRRGLMRFSLTPEIPFGSTINAATLTVNISQAAAAGFTPVSVHRLLASWGEGTSNSGTPGGSGAPATPGDATWLHRFFDTDFWLTPGGDFAPGATATATPSSLGAFSISGLAGDVQTWLDLPATNHGWLLRLSSETTSQTAIRLDSRENPVAGLRPALRVSFRAGGDANADDLVNLSDFAVLAANFNQGLFGPDNGDFNRDSIVDLADFAILAINFNRDFSRAAVPEPRLGVVAGAIVLIRSLRKRRSGGKQPSAEGLTRKPAASSDGGG